METIIVFILILGILVLVHEWGHFMTAIKLGIDVEEFAIGFPPKMFQYTKNGIKYSINWLPIGGFVKIKGESGGDRDDPKSFVAQPTWKKALVVTAGVVMNFILAIVLFSIIFYYGLPQLFDQNIPVDKIKESHVIIYDVLPDSPAESQGLNLADEILAINDGVYKNSEEFHEVIQQNNDRDIKITVKRGEDIMDFTVTPEIIEDSEQPIMGIAMVDTVVVDYGFFGSIWQAIKTTGVMIQKIIIAFGDMIKDLVTRGKVTADVSGPVGVAVIAGQIIKLGWLQVLQFAAVLSINLGVINILPFPALDGGRLLFIIIEGLRGKPLNEKAENIIHNSGFIFLIGLIIVVTFKDLFRFGPGIWESIKNMF